MKKMIVFFAGVFGALLAHDARLYPHLHAVDLLVLATLRLLLLLFPLIGMAVAVKAKTKTPQFILGVMLWAIFVPYTIYSAAEIRHVADWCRLPADTFFTQMCAQDSWSLFPTFIYAVTGVVIFCVTLQMLENRIRGLWQKVALDAVVILFTSSATTFGLITRFNVWNAFLHPLQAANAFAGALNGTFLLNVGLISIFTAFQYWSFVTFVPKRNGRS